ncbi:Serine/threonine-protein kinase ATG1c [Vitis vinifera]|uniref:Serine/threonine-protein kinase ATG1c n=1 Tax=Vitis vinifera TaxID=29760 RepID=A0A438EA29_VITVI|nr:Serine/threonine-protein kinase ATG1c [Vitis vinifera]
MAQTPSRGRVVGDYLVGRQIGSGSFSVVWHARHRVHGTEVAIKEIVTGRLNKKLQERGDLSMYIQSYVRVPEATAKHFMQQLAAGLQVLRDNNLIHRDLKPQYIDDADFEHYGSYVCWRSMGIVGKDKSISNDNRIRFQDWKKFKGTFYGEEVREGYGVGLWKAIRKGWDAFKSKISYDLGNGRRIRFWKHIWCGDTPLRTSLPSLFIIATSKDACVCDAWEQADLGVSREVGDKVVWMATKGGQFLVKSFYYGMLEEERLNFGEQMFSMQSGFGVAYLSPTVQAMLLRTQASQPMYGMRELTPIETSEEHNGKANLLLSTNDNNSVLKIADFGFARSLQPRGLAETLCGSPLYMAPEIMQLQKYDAKADLWSVGAILFQLVTGRTPFTGNNQIQLLQNIVKSSELHFPPDNNDLSADCKDLCQKLLRRNPVERLTFEEFFNHPFLSRKQPDEALSSRRSSRIIDGFPLSECNPVRNTEESSQEDCMPFPLDDDSSGPEGSPSFLRRRSSMKSTYGFSLDKKVDRRETIFNTPNNMDLASKYSSASHKPEITGFRIDSLRPSDENVKEPLKSMEQRPMRSCSRVVDSLEELVDQDYVFVSGPPMDVSSSSAIASKPSHSQCRSGSAPLTSVNMKTKSSAPMPIAGAGITNTFYTGSLESHSSAPSGTSQGSMDIGDALEQPSTHCMTRIKSLQQCASVITELVNEKIEAGKQLEAFSIQLVILAIWKQALHICHTQAASAMEGSPTQETSRLRRSTDKKHGSPDMRECLDIVNNQGPGDICSQIEREFLHQVGHAEELAKVIEPGSTEMPDAMEMIFQSALALGRNGAVDELMGDVESAVSLYSKAVHLLVFLLVEAPSLILNPPFSLTNSDRYRLRTYIDILNIRQVHSRSQRMNLLKCEDQQCPP